MIIKKQNYIETWYSPTRFSKKYIKSCTETIIIKHNKEEEYVSLSSSENNVSFFLKTKYGLNLHRKIGPARTTNDCLRWLWKSEQKRHNGGPVFKWLINTPRTNRLEERYWNK